MCLSCCCCLKNERKKRRLITIWSIFSIRLLSIFIDLSNNLQLCFKHRSLMIVILRLRWVNSFTKLKNFRFTPQKTGFYQTKLFFKVLMNWNTVF